MGAIGARGRSPWVGLEFRVSFLLCGSSLILKGEWSLLYENGKGTAQGMGIARRNSGNKHGESKKGGSMGVKSGVCLRRCCEMAGE